MECFTLLYYNQILYYCIIRYDLASQIIALFRNLDNNNDQFGQNHELSLQESQFAEMIQEMSCYDFPQNTLSMFLQYCPESVTHLFDKCIMPLGVQVKFFFPFIFSIICMKKSTVS